MISTRSLNRDKLIDCAKPIDPIELGFEEITRVFLFFFFSRSKIELCKSWRIQRLLITSRSIEDLD